MGQAVTQLFEALRYKSEGRGFNSRWCHWNSSLTQSFQPHFDLQDPLNSWLGGLPSRSGPFGK